MKYVYGIMAVTLFLIINIGCASQSDLEDDTIVVAFAQSGNPNPWMVALTESIAEAASENSVKYLYTDSNDNVDRHVQNINDLVDQGIDYLIVAPQGDSGLKEALERAEGMGVKIILTGRTTEGPYTTVVYSDQSWEGAKCAELIGEQNAEARVVEIRGIEGTSSVEGRASGFRSELDKYPDIEIVAEVTANFNMTEAMEAMTKVLDAVGPEYIDAVFAHNDNMALGAIQAIKDAGLEPGVDIIVIGIDGQKEALDAIIRGELLASVQCSPNIGEYIFEVINKLENGEEVPLESIVPDIIFDDSNAKESYDLSF